MILLLLSYSKSWSENDVSTTTDSVLVAISDIRVANAKMVELKYEKEINSNLRQIVKNDSVAINALREKIDYTQAQSKKYRKQRNVVGGVGASVLILLIISLL